MLRFCRVLSGLLLLAGSAAANDIFVDNIVGLDSNDGFSATIQQGNTGPVRTLGRAAQLATSGDTIYLKNTQTPYYDSLSLMGSRHSGTAYRPFTIVGNGATISGLRSVPAEGWRKEKEKIWKLTPSRKGYYQLLRNSQLLTEYVPAGELNPLESLPPAQWVSWKGVIYFRQDGVEPPTYQNFAITSDQTGISLHQVQNVLIVDLVVQHFRFDGIHAQGLCDTVELHNVTSVENGRAGVVSSGTSTVHMYGGTVDRNGRAQILALDRSKAESHEAIEPDQN